MRSIRHFPALLIVLLAATVSAAPRPKARRKVIRLEAMDRCMGRVEKPVVLIVLSAPEMPTPDVAVEWLRKGQALAEKALVNDLAGAAADFEKAAAAPSNAIHEAALFELGRARYRLDDNARAATAFADALDSPTHALTPETIRYLALSLGDTCNQGSLERARTFVAAHKGKSWLADLWRELSSLLFDLSERESADAAWKEVGALDPKAVRPPAPTEVTPTCDATIITRVLLRKQIDILKCGEKRWNVGVAQRARLRLEASLPATRHVLTNVNGGAADPISPPSPLDGEIHVTEDPSGCVRHSLSFEHIPPPEENCQIDITFLRE